MATTNLQQWNPTAANQETDAEYTADAQRAGGATDPSVFQSVLANKVFFQLSTYLTALFQAFAAKGFTTSDSNLSTLTATCAGFLTTADKVAVDSSTGGPLVSAEQLGSGYTSAPNTAAIVSGTQGASTNYLFSGIDSGGTVNFWVQAGGTLYAVLAQLGSAIVSGLVQAASLLVSGNANVGSLQIGGTAPNGQVLIGNGTSYVPSNVAIRGALTTNSNGSYFRWSDGVIEAWGSVSVPPSGNAFNTATITFPAAFVGTPSLTFSTVGYAGSGDSTTPPAVETYALSNTGATIFMARVIVASAGGGNFDNTLTLVWHAIGV